MGPLATLMDLAGSNNIAARPEAWSPTGWLAPVRSHSGVQVTDSSARTLSAVFLAVRAISEDVAKVPLRLYERTDNGKSEVDSHPIARLLKNPNPLMTAMSVRESIAASMLLHGMGYAEIVRDGAGRPAELHLIHPSRVRPTKVDNGRRIVWRVYATDCIERERRDRRDWMVEIPDADMIAVRGHGDCELGLSTVRYAAESMGTGIAAQRQAGSVFRNGMKTRGAWVHPKNLDEKARANLREMLQHEYAGPGNAGKDLLLWGGLEYKPLSMPMEDAELLDTRKFEVTEVARWFRIPPSKLMDREGSTWNNNEAEQTAYVTDAIHPLAARIEQEFARKLIPINQPRLYIKHQLQALVRGDMKTRAGFYSKMFNMGALSIDDIRELEDLNTLGTAASKAHYLQGGYTTIELAHQGVNYDAGRRQSSGDAPSATGEADGTATATATDPDPDETSTQAAHRDRVHSLLQAAVQREITRHRRATAGKPPAEAAAWLRRERDRLIESLAAHCGHGSDLILDDYIARSTVRGEPASSITELTDRLMETIDGHHPPE